MLFILPTWFAFICAFCRWLGAVLYGTQPAEEHLLPPSIHSRIKDETILKKIITFLEKKKVKLCCFLQLFSDDTSKIEIHLVLVPRFEGKINVFQQ